MADGLVLEALRRALAALRAAGREPVLVGGLAIQAWGRARQTKDVDLLLLADAAHRESVLQNARAHGLSPDPVHPEVRIEGVTILRLLYTDPKYGLTIHVDLMEAGTPFLEAVVGRAIRARVQGEDLRLATCEDLVLMKLAAGRPIDRVDATELMRVNAGSLDRGYLRAQAKTLGLDADLGQCEAEAAREP